MDMKEKEVLHEIKEILVVGLCTLQACTKTLEKQLAVIKKREAEQPNTSYPPGKIVAFPPPERAKPQRPAEEPMPLFSEYCDMFIKLGFGDFKCLTINIFYAMYYLHIRSLEELAITPPESLRCRRGVGEKTIAAIRTVLESKGFTLGKEWDRYD